MSKKWQVIASLCFGLAGISTLFTNCGQGFKVAEQSASSLSAPDTSQPQDIPILANVTAPARAETSHCSAMLQITTTDTPPTPQYVTVSAAFRDNLFSDAACTLPLDAANLKTNQLPITAYLRSDELIQDDFYVTIGGQVSNKAPVNVYRADFSNVDTSSTGAFYLNDNITRTQLPFALGATNSLTITTTDIFDPKFQPSVVAATPTTPKLLSAAGATRRIGFNEVGVFNNNTMVSTDKANSITHALKVASGVIVTRVCYTAKNEVYCSADGTTYTKINLPAGSITDFQNPLVYASCAVVSGKVYCWSADGVPAEMTQLSNDVKQIAVNSLSAINDASPLAATDLDKNGSRVCVLKINGKVSCVVNGVLADIGVQNVKRIAGGYGARNSIAYEQRDPASGASTWTMLDLVSGVARPFPANTTFDELKFLPGGGAGYPLGGCGRSGTNLVCFRAKVADATIATLQIPNVAYFTPAP